MKKKVAIVLSAYNGEKYIKQQIDSILSQTYSNFVLYIHDDGSSDFTLDIIKEYEQKFDNVHIIVDEKGLKYPACFIKMLSTIQGYDYYAFSDQDDVWESDKLSNAIEILNKNNNSLPLLYYTSVEYTDSNLKHIRDSRFAKGKKEICKLSFQNLLFGGEALGMTFVFNDIAKKNLVNANESNDFKDWFLKLYCGLCGEVYYNPKSSAKYRRHDFAVTSNSNPAGNFERYFAQLYEIFIKKDTFKTQKDILEYIKNNHYDSILDDNLELFDLFSDNLKCNRFKKVFWSKKFRDKFVDDLGYRLAFLLGRM